MITQFQKEMNTTVIEIKLVLRNFIWDSFGYGDYIYIEVGMHPKSNS